MGVQISQFGPSAEGQLAGKVAAYTRLLCRCGGRQSITAGGRHGGPSGPGIPLLS